MKIFVKKYFPLKFIPIYDFNTNDDFLELDFANA